MDKKERQEIERQRRETALKNTFFNRFLLLRYSIALFFFGNIYWVLIQFIRPSLVMIFPIILVVFSILATVEQFRLYGKRSVRLGITQMFVCLQAIISTGLLVLTWTSWFTYLFPIFENNQLARVFVFIVLLLGLVISLLDIRRIQDIYQQKDKAFQRYIQLEKSSLNL
jgi:putative membrane protein